MKQFRNMRELELKKQNLNFQVQYLEERMRSSSGDLMLAVGGWMKGIAFASALKMVLSLFFKTFRKKRK